MSSSAAIHLTANDPPSEPNRASLLRAAQIRRAFGSGDSAPYAISMHLSGILSAALVATLLWASVPTVRVLPWVLIAIACHGLAILQIKAYRRLQPGVHQSARWGAYKVLQMTLLGLIWGAGVPVLYVPGVTEALLLPVIAVVAQSSTSVGSHADYPEGLYALLVSSILPAATFLLWFAGGGQTETFTGYALVVLLVALLVTGRGVAQVIADALLTRIDLATALAQERRQRAETERARGEAEAAREQTTRFFSAVGHDLRQPVHALGLYTALLRGNPPERERQELVENVSSCADNLDALFNALLGVAQIHDAPAQLNVTVLSLRKLIAQVIVQFTPDAQRKGLVLRAMPTSLWVRSDEAALARILGNLVANAIRYTASGRVVVGVRRRRTGCQLVVADTGIGIDLENQARVFANFYQVNNPSRDPHKGFGLGLAIVHKLCESLGHAVELRSRLGVGSLFSVRLDCAPSLSDTAPIEPQVVTPPDLHVLIIEDDARARDALQKLLVSWNLPTRTCTTGDEALTILREAPERRWHVLIDYRLAEGENGLEIATRLRAACAPAPAIALITGEADPTVLEVAVRLRIPVLSKPVKPIRLRSLLTS